MRAVAGATRSTGFYYAITDERGVLCVDEVGSGEYTLEMVAEKLAGPYPDAIYFAHPTPEDEPEGLPPLPTKMLEGKPVPLVDLVKAGVPIYMDECSVAPDAAD